MAKTTFQQGRKPKNTRLAGKIKCGHGGYALKATHVPDSTGYFRCTQRTENKACPVYGISAKKYLSNSFSRPCRKNQRLSVLHGREEK
jgi:hypothetical protein